MGWQQGMVMLIVAVASVHVAWTIMPARGRRALAGWLLAQRWVNRHARWRAGLLRHHQRGSGCGCSGCDAGSPVQQGRSAVIQIVRRPPKN